MIGERAVGWERKEWLFCRAVDISSEEVLISRSRLDWVKSKRDERKGASYLPLDSHPSSPPLSRTEHPQPQVTSVGFEGIQNPARFGLLSCQGLLNVMASAQEKNQ